ncbi:hypothetical protein KVR01_012109 [Diaporthe batatas]|uniref:uncharacterized protein n=1 Tax=Diaporthe batatas TaxID=748121 RepID=UPI001D05097C|nr:uncharacterized protein KVR01_012109 [Diaporthe batatas]KAG8158348.1 hypothetical protein KVR01_012109 [Diaporthe batatas]
MADDPGSAGGGDDSEGDLRSGELDLLKSGNFADVDIVCGDRTWKCHRAILVPRSAWFQKALSGPFEEASTRQIKLDEENPDSVDLALKYIYSRGLEVESSIAPNNFVEQCVCLWHLADFLLLGPLKPLVEKAVHSYCDKRMKQFCTFGVASDWMSTATTGELTPWALDLISGVRQSYKWNAEHLKAVLMEFLWVGRFDTLRFGGASVLFHHLTDTPKFMDDFLGYYASGNWIPDRVWAVLCRKEATLQAGQQKCRRCLKHITWSHEDRNGQIADPFELVRNTVVTTGWCRDCSKLDTIPWREENDG